MTPHAIGSVVTVLPGFRADGHGTGKPHADGFEGAWYVVAVAMDRGGCGADYGLTRSPGRREDVEVWIRHSRIAG